jgi:hypothetical protein
MLEQGLTIQEIADQISSEFEIPPEVGRRDVERFMASLKMRSLVVVTGDAVSDNPDSR